MFYSGPLVVQDVAEMLVKYARNSRDLLDSCSLRCTEDPIAAWVTFANVLFNVFV